MRKLISILIVGYCLGFFCKNGMAQGGSLVVGGNVIKTNITSAAIAHYQLQYERVTGPNQSFAIGFGISPNVKLPFAGVAENAAGDDEQAVEAVKSIRFTKFTVTPEYRFYISKKGAPKGFYLATFARYTHMSMENIFPYTSEAGVDHKIHVEGKFNGYGAGAMIGIQWLLGKNFTLDWWIVGPFIGGMSSEFTGVDHSTEPLSPTDQVNLKEDIEAVEIPLWTIDATVNSSTVNIDLSGPFYGARFMGLCFGVRF